MNDEKNMISEKKPSWWKRWLANKTFVVAVVVAVVAAVLTLGISNAFKPNSTTTKLGFEDIGELATQSAYCTQVNDPDDTRKLFGTFDIPFTENTIIYSYNVVIKAGFDFAEIKYDVDEENKKISVEMPEARILSSEIDQDSLEIYVEDESIFNNFTLEERNDEDKKMVEKAKRTSVENGLLENARSNAEVIIKGFFSNQYDMDEFEIEFTHKISDEEKEIMKEKEKAEKEKEEK